MRQRSPYLCSIKILFENCDTDSLFWGEMKYLDKNEVTYNKLTKNGNSFYISKRDREVFLLQLIKHL